MKKALKVIGAVIAVAGVVAAAYYFIKKYLDKKQDNCTCEECEDICCFDADGEICDCESCVQDEEAVEIEEDKPAE